MERITVKLPPGFDPDRHLSALEKKIADVHGPGFTVDSIDPSANVAYATRQASITEVTATLDDKDRFTVRLPRGTKPSDGDKVSAKFEDQYAGFFLAEFRPALGNATLERMSQETVRCRAAVAGVLGVKPWEVRCRPRNDGGFELELPPKYVPSRHDEKLGEVASSVVGAEGWFVDINAKTLRGNIIPGEPPTFPAAIPYPFDALRSADRSKLLIGQALPDRADQKPTAAYIDFNAAPHSQVSGTSGSGKTILLEAMITYALASGSRLALVDLPFKGVDFKDFRPFVHPGYWGAAEPTSTIEDWLPEALAVMGAIYDEGMKRAGLLDKYGVAKVDDLPEKAAVPPIFLVCDEVTGILQLDEVPKGLPKDNPLVVEATYKNLLRQMILNYMKRIGAELRFAGIRMVLSSQVSSVNTGVPTSLRMNLAQKVLLGVNPTDGNRKLALADPGSVPVVPDNIRADGAAGRGAGVAELEGQANIVFKAPYAPVSKLVSALRELGVPTHDSVRPTRTQIDKYIPMLLDDDEPPSRQKGSEPRKMQNTGLGAEWMTDPETGERLSGFAKANAARHAASS